MLDRTSPPNRAHLPPSTWTHERDELLKGLWTGALSARQVAAEIGGFSHCSDGGKNAVVGRAHRLGLPNLRNPFSHHKRPKRAANKDRSATQRIAKKLRVRGAANGGAQLVECVVREEAPQPQDFLGITFADLEPGQCKFPRGEGADIRFCGQPRMSGEPYCKNCCAVAFTYTPPPVKRPYYATGGSKPAVF